MKAAAAPFGGVRGAGMSDAPRRSLEDLEMRGDFVRRHIGPGKDDIEEMLALLGLDSLDGLIEQAVPPAIRSDHPFDLPAPMSERETVTATRRMRERNRVFISMMGMGYSGTVLPGVIKRNVLENPGWYTAYTPYQAEVSQGRLEALLNFQQMVMDLTGMELANASLLDEATAAAEAMAMARRLSKSDSNTFFVDRDCHPQTIAVMRTRARPMGWKIVIGDPFEDLEDRVVFGALVQYPGSSGSIRDPGKVIARVQRRHGLAIVAADLLALCLLKSPGALGADVVVGSAQRFGVPMGYGGPHAAFFATRDACKRSAPRAHHRGLGGRTRPGRRCAWRSRPASSTSAGRRRPATSAPRRCCLPTLPDCTRCTTAPAACVPSRSACTG